VSAASAWEIATKHRVGRLPAGGLIVRRWEQIVHQLGASELPITSEHGLLAGGFDAPNRDPFDRLLAAQAIVEGARLVTADGAMDGFGAELLW
jgi:PIN domain nuclease of toxin-antitoxin system